MPLLTENVSDEDLAALTRRVAEGLAAAMRSADDPRMIGAAALAQAARARARLLLSGCDEIAHQATLDGRRVLDEREERHVRWARPRIERLLAAASALEDELLPYAPNSQHPGGT